MTNREDKQSGDSAALVRDLRHGSWTAQVEEMLNRAADRIEELERDRDHFFQLSGRYLEELNAKEEASRSSCAATLTAYVDELERRAREQKEWEGHPKYEGEYPSEVMQVIVNELRERFTLPESEATVAFHKLLQDEGEEYEGPDAPAAPTPPYSATMTEESLDRWLGRFCNQAVDGSVRVEQAKSLLRELLGSSLSATEASKP